MPAELNSSGALSGLRVLDLTGRMGGYCGLLLANLGADVILIEPPAGDPMRREGPFKNDVVHPDGSLSFAAYHTNKKGIVLDLKTTEGQTKLCALAANSDVLIEDLPLGYLDRIGLGYQALRVIRPSLVMTRSPAWASRVLIATSHNIVAAMGGLMNLCGHPNVRRSWVPVTLRTI
jgi:crotonobetainyl-CoA:carnitine CoA-transferase CaiB-like acyl-CoA transferase